MDGFEYDPAKNRSNVEKHRIDFDQAKRAWEGPVVEFEDTRFDYGERRFIALGAVEERIVIVVYTWRGASRRLISGRKANSDERKTYEAALAAIRGR